MMGGGLAGDGGIRFIRYFLFALLVLPPPFLSIRCFLSRGFPRPSYPRLLGKPERFLVESVSFLWFRLPGTPPCFLDGPFQLPRFAGPFFFFFLSTRFLFCADPFLLFFPLLPSVVSFDVVPGVFAPVVRIEWYYDNAPFNQRKSEKTSGAAIEVSGVTD